MPGLKMRLGEAGCISIYRINDMRSNVSQTTLEGGLNECILNASSGHLHFYLTLSSCDPFAQDAFQNQV